VLRPRPTVWLFDWIGTNFEEDDCAVVAARVAAAPMTPETRSKLDRPIGVASLASSHNETNFPKQKRKHGSMPNVVDLYFYYSRRFAGFGS
jgi:hypothetical protein